jgi:hypothetical protein
MGRNTRYLVIIPAVFFALFARPAKADVLGEWTYSQSCPTSGSIEVIDNTIILHGPDQGGCSGAAHWVKIESTIPADVDTIDFEWAYQTTDGWVYDPPQYGINGVYTLITQQNNATGLLSVPVSEGDVFTFRQYSIDTCCAPGHLTISNLSLWESITTSTTAPTTTTSTVPSTTVPVTNPTTTTVQETSTTTTTSVENSTSTTSTTTTTSSVPQTTLPVSEPTMPEPSTTTTSTTTSIVPETTTTTEPESPPVAQPPVEVQPEPTEDTTPPDTEPTPEETELPVEETEPIASDPPVEDTYPTVYPEETLPFVEEPVVEETIPETPETPLEAPLSDEEVDSLIAEAETTEALIEALAELSPEQVEQVVESLLAEEPTEEQATALASSPEVLAVVTTEQAQQIFEALNITELDNTQVAELIAAIESAPTEIREEFEDTIDIFGEGLDDYTPTGSNIPVGERRTLIAATVGLTLAAAGTRIRR